MNNPSAETVSAPGVEAKSNPVKDLLVFSLGAVVALAVTYWTGRELWQTFQARSWTAVPCKIIRFDAEAER